MTTPRYNFVTRDEFDLHLYKTNQRFNDLTEIMLGEFDKVYEKFSDIDKKFERMDKRFDGLESDMQLLKRHFQLV